MSDEPVEPPDDKVLAPKEQERVTAWRILRRVYLRVACEGTGQRIDDLTVQEQEVIIEKWRQALVNDWTQMCEVLAVARAASEMAVLEHLNEEQREALILVLNDARST